MSEAVVMPDGAGIKNCVLVMPIAGAETGIESIRALIRHIEAVVSPIALKVPLRRNKLCCV